METDDYVNLVRANVTKTYKKTEQKEVVEINREARRIAESLELGDRIDKLAEREVVRIALRVFMYCSSLRFKPPPITHCLAFSPDVAISQLRTFIFPAV